MAGRRGRRDKPKREQKKKGKGFPLARGQVVFVGGRKSQKAVVLRPAKSGNRVVVGKKEAHKQVLSRKSQAQMDVDVRRVRELEKKFFEGTLTPSEKGTLEFLWRRMLRNQVMTKIVRLPQVTTVSIKDAVLSKTPQKPRYQVVPRIERQRTRRNAITAQLRSKYRNPKRLQKELLKRLGRIPKKPAWQRKRK